MSGIKLKDKKRVFLLLLLTIVMAFCCIFGVFFTQNNKTAGATASGSTALELSTTSNTITTSQKSAYEKLISAISTGAGKAATTSYDTMSANIGTNPVKADKFAGYKVTFGGYTWNIAYVTKTRTPADKTNAIGDAGDVVVTLWLADVGKYAGMGSTIVSQFSDKATDDVNKTYPSSMYSTSIVRSSLVGSQYSTNNTTLTNGAQNGAWTRFTSDSQLGKYISTPAQIAYQETEYTSTYTYYFPNDAYGQVSGAKTWYQNSSGGTRDMKLIQTKSHYGDWKTDKLWLPSMSETGWDTTNVGMWGVTAAQRGLTHESGDSESYNTAAGDTRYSWLRSGSYAYARSARLLDSSGGYHGSNTYRYYAVRPALHLNLKSAAEAAGLLGTPIDKPTAKTGLTYTGSAQDLVEGFDTTTMTATCKFTPAGSTTEQTLAANTVKFSDAGKYNFVFTPKSGYNWKNGASNDLSVTVAQATTTASASVASGTYYVGDALSTAKISVASSGTPGSIAWTAPTTALKSGNNAYGWTFTPTNTNYKTVTGTASVNAVAKLTGITVSGATTSYTAYDKFKTDGMTVTAAYAGGVASKAVTGYTITYPTNGEDKLLYADNGKDVTISYTESGITKTATVKVTVAKKDYSLTGVTFADDTVTYDKNPHSITVSGTLPSGLTISGYTYNGTSAANATNAGTYTVKPVFQSTDSANYNLPSLSATLTIKKATQKFTVEDATLDYDAHDQTVKVTVPDTEQTVTLSTSTVKNAGKYTITATAEATTNYEKITEEIEITVNKFNLVLVWDGKGKTYDGNTVSANLLTYIDCAPPDDADALKAEYSKIVIKYTGTLKNGQSYDSQKQPVNAGTYKPEVVSYPEGILDNYNITINNAETYSLEISQQKFTPVFNGAEITFDNKPHTITVTAGVPSEILVTYKVGETEFTGATDAGSYSVKATFTDGSGNYVIPDLDPAILKINPADISSATVSGIDSSYVYAGGTVNPAASATAVVTIVLDGETVTLGSDDYTLAYSVDGGAYVAGKVGTAKFTGKGNFTGEKNVTFDIAKATLTATWTVGTYVYSGEAQAPSATLSGVVSGDTVTPVITYVGVDGTSYNSSDKPVKAGSYKAVLKVEGQSNYENLTSEQPFTIEKAKITVEVSYDYGGATVLYEGEALPKINLTSATCNGKAIEGKLGWALVDGKEPVIKKGSNDYTWEFVPADTENYETATGIKRLNGQEADIKSITAELKADAPAVYTTVSLSTVRSYITATATLTDNTEITYTGYTLTGDWGAGEYPSAAGKHTLTLTCPNGQSCTLEVTYVQTKLERLDVEYDDVSAGTLYEGKALDSLKDYLTVTAKFNDELKNAEIEADGYTLTADCGETLTSGKHTVTVSYTDSTYGKKTATFKITVERFTVKDISAKLSDGAKIYSTTTEEELIKSLEVTATYSDDSTAKVSGFTVAYGTLTAGDTVTVTVAYGEKTCEVNVYVQAIELTEITADWTSSQPTVYPSTDVESLKSAITVTAKYTGAADETVTDYTISGDLSAAGNTTLTISYGGKTAKISVNVSALPSGESLRKIEANFNQGSVKIFETDGLDVLNDLLEVKAYYGVNDSSLTGKTVQSGAYNLSVAGDKFEVGANTVTVTYGGKTDTFTVVVSSVDPGSIIVEWKAGSQPVIYNDATLDDLRGLITVLGSKNGKPVDDYSLSGDLSAGVAVITVTSGDLTTTFNVEVTAVAVVSLEITGQGALGVIYETTDIQSFKDKLTVTAVYNNGKRAAVGNYTLSGTLAAGKTCTITVTGNGATGTFEVTVADKQLTGLKVTYTQGSTPVYSYNTLSELTTGGRGALSVKAVFSDNKESTLTAGEYALSGTLTSGACVITVSYNGVTGTFTVNVTEVSLVSVKAEFDGSGVIYDGAALEDLTARLTVTAVYGDGNTKQLAAGDYELSGELKIGENEITLTYDGVSTTFGVVITANKLESIYAEFDGGVAVYESESLDFLKDNLKVYATYSDGSVSEITLYTLSGTLSAGSDCTITVNYSGKSATFSVSVEGRELDADEALEVSWNGAQPTVYDYTDIESLRTSLIVKVKLAGGASETVTGYAISGDLKSPSATITITYNGKSATLPVTVTAAEVTLTGITAVYAQGGEKLFGGVTLDDIKTKLEVTAEYSNGTSKTVDAGYTLSGSLTVGKNVLTVTYGDKTAEFTVTVYDVALESLTAEFDAGKVGDITLATTLDELKAGLKVSGHKNNGDLVENITDYTLTGDISKVGENVITVSKDGITTTFTVKATGDATLDSVSVTVDFGSDKVYLSVDKEELRKYLTVTAKYGDVSKVVTDYTINEIKNAGGKYTVTVTYCDVESSAAELDFTAVALEKIFATFNPTGTVYTSTKLDSLKSMITLTGVNNDGTPAGVLAVDFNVSGVLKAGKSQLTVEYNGLTATVTVDVTAVKVTELTVEVNTLPTVYASTDIGELKNYIVVKAQYNDGSASKTLNADEYTISGTLVAGENCVITVSYNGADGEFTVAVSDRTIDRISALYTQDGVIYSSDDIESLREKLAVSVYYSDAKDTAVPLTEGYKLSGDLTGGSCRITVTYNGKEAYFNVTVTEVALVAVGVEKKDMPEIFTTTALDTLKSYLTVTAKYGNGETKEVAAENYTLTADGGLKVGENTLTVTYGGKTAQIKVGVSAANLTGISAEISENYKVYETSNLDVLKSWLSVTADYADGKQAPVYDYELSGVLVAGKTATITVTYGGASTTVDVFVEAKKLVKITADYTGGEVAANSALGDLKKNLTVKAYFEGDTDGVVLGESEYALEGTLSAGSTVTVKAVYGDKSETFTVTVKAEPKLSSIKAIFNQGDVKVFETDSLDSLKNMLTVKAYYTEDGFAAGEKVLEAGEYVLSGALSGGVITVDFGGIKTTFTVKVTPVALSSLTVAFDGSKVGTVTAATQFSALRAGLTVTGTNNNGTPYQSGAAITGYDITGDLVAGKTCTLTVTYDGVSASFSVTVTGDATLESVSVQWSGGSQDITVYENSDVAELIPHIKVTAGYSGGATRVIEYPAYSFVTAAFSSVGGKCTVTVSYLGKTNMIEVTITPKALKEIHANFNQNGKPVYSSDNLEDLIKNGTVTLNVTGVYNDGSFESAVADYTLEYDLTKDGKVTVKKGELSAEFTVIIIADGLEKVEASFSQGADDILYASTGIDGIKTMQSAGNENLLKVYATYTNPSLNKYVDNKDVTLTISGVTVETDDYIDYSVKVSYFGIDSDTAITVRVTKVKLVGITTEFDESAFAASGTVVYDSYSAEEAYAKLKDFVKVTGTYNDGDVQPLNTGDLNASGSLADVVGGKATVKLTLSGTTLSDEISFTVTPVELQSIVATFRQSGTGTGLVFTTDTFDGLKEKISSGDRNITLSVKVIFNNGTERELNADEYELVADENGIDENGKLKQGTLVVTVKYKHGEKSAEDTFAVTVSAVNVQSLTASYVEKVYTTTTTEEFKSKLAVIAVYTDGAIERIAVSNCIIDYTAANFKGQAGKEITVNITYNGKAASVKFKVEKAEVVIDLSSYDDYEYTFVDGLETQSIDKKAVLKSGDKIIDAELTYANLTFTEVPASGKITISVSFDGNDDYLAASASTAEIVINKKSVDLSGLVFEYDGEKLDSDNALTTVFDGKTHTLVMDVGLNGVTVVRKLTYSNDGTTFATVGEIKNAGVYKYEVKLTFDGNHKNADGDDEVVYTATITVEKKELNLDGIKFALDTLVFEEDTKVLYDGNAHTAGINGTLPEGVSAKLTVNDKEDLSIVKAGNYALKIAFTYDANYTGIESITAALEVEKDKPVINVDDIKNTEWTYTGEEQTITATLEKGDKDSKLVYRVDGVEYSDGYKFTDVPEGGKILLYIYTVASDNYKLGEVTLTVYIHKAKLTVTAPDLSVEYGSLPKAEDLALTATGYIGSDDEASLGLSSYKAYTDYVLYGVVSGEGVEYHTLVPDIALKNYEVEKVNGTLTVNKKSVSVEWNGLTAVYDGKAHLPEASYKDVNGDSVALKVGLPAEDNPSLTDGKAVNAGKYVVTISGLNVNYEYDVTDNELNITPATIGVTGTGDKWVYKADLDTDSLITLDEKDGDGNYKRISLTGAMTSADVRITYSSYAYTSAPKPENDDSYTNGKPGLVFGGTPYKTGTYYVNYCITVANHTTYKGQWKIEILPEDVKNVVEIIFNKPIELDYGDIPSTAAETAALIEELYDGYLTVNGLDRATFLADMKISLVVNNDTEVSNATDAGVYNIYFAFKDADKYKDWSLFYKGTDDLSDTNVGKLVIKQRKLTVEWSGTEFVSNGALHLPTATISGFADGKDYELSLDKAQSATFEIERDGKKITLTATLTGDFVSAGAHKVELEISDGNYVLDAPATSVSLTAPKAITVSVSSYFYFVNDKVQLPEITVNGLGEAKKIALTQEMLENGGGVVEVDLGEGGKVSFKVTLEGDFKSEGISRITVVSQDERFVVSTGEQSVTFTEAAITAPVKEEESQAFTPVTVGIIAAVCGVAALSLIAFIVALKRKPAGGSSGSGDDDGFGDYVE